MACVIFLLDSITLEQKSANYSLWITPGPLPSFVNKVLLEHSRTHTSTYCPWHEFVPPVVRAPSGSLPLDHQGRPYSSRIE